jgi:hypothetical protein
VQASQKTKFANFFIWCRYFRLSYSNKYHLFNKYTLYIDIEVSDFINCFDLRRHAAWPTLLGFFADWLGGRAPCPVSSLRRDALHLRSFGSHLGGLLRFFGTVGEHIPRVGCVPRHF